MVDELHRASVGPEEQWLLTRYEAAHAPGGLRNAVLVPGEPQLTFDMSTAYADYIEWLLGLSVTGLTQEQRRDLQGMLVHDWHVKEARLRIIDDLSTWSTVTRLPPDQ